MKIATSLLLAIVFLSAASSQSWATDPLSLSIAAPGSLLLSGSLFDRYRVQYSPDLSTGSWLLLKDMTMAASSAEVLDPDGVNVQRRFYRALKPIYLADSNRDFSGTQGSGGWWYGYKQGVTSTTYSASAFIPMVFGPEFQAVWAIDENVWYVSATNYWTNIQKRKIHPNGTVSTTRTPAIHWPVRRWVSNTTGAAIVTINAADESVDPDAGANGVINRVFKDNTEISVTNIGVGESKEITFFTYISVGTVIDFVIDPNAGNHTYDSTGQQIFIELIQ